MAGDAVADQLDVAVVPAADQHPLFAAYIHLAQDGLGGLLFYRGHAVTLHIGDLLHAEGDLLRVGVAVGVQPDDIPRLQHTGLPRLKIAVVVPCAVVAGTVRHDPAILFIGDGKLVVADTVAAQHILTLRTAAEPVGAGRQRNALLVAQLGDQNDDLTCHGAAPLTSGMRRRRAAQR